MQDAINQEVVARLAAQNATIKEALITTKVDEELERRKQLAVDALEEIESLTTQLTTMGQDALFDDAGKPLLTGYNAKQNAERQRLKEKIEKLETVLANALGEKADWSGLEK